MQDHFEKVAMDKAIEAGGKKAFELLDEAIERFTESLKFTDAGGKELRSEIAGYRKGLLELYRTQLQNDSLHEPVPAIPEVVQAQHPSTQPVHSSRDLSEAHAVLEKEITGALEQFADSYTTLADTTSLILTAVGGFTERALNADH